MGSRTFNFTPFFEPFPYRVASQLKIPIHVGWWLGGIVVDGLRLLAIRLASVWAELGNVPILKDTSSVIDDVYKHCC